MLDLLRTYVARASDLTPLLADAQINDDLNMRLQYLAGMGLNLYQSEAIYADMLAYSRYPDNLFTGSESTTASLRQAILRAQGKY